MKRNARRPRTGSRPRIASDRTSQHVCPGWRIKHNPSSVQACWAPKKTSWDGRAGARGEARRWTWDMGFSVPQRQRRDSRSRTRDRFRGPSMGTIDLQIRTSLPPHCSPLQHPGGGTRREAATGLLVVTRFEGWLPRSEKRSRPLGRGRTGRVASGQWERHARETGEGEEAVHFGQLATLSTFVMATRRPAKVTLSYSKVWNMGVDTDSCAWDAGVGLSLVFSRTPEMSRPSGKCVLKWYSSACSFTTKPGKT